MSRALFSRRNEGLFTIPRGFTKNSSTPQARRHWESGRSPRVWSQAVWAISVWNQCNIAEFRLSVSGAPVEVVDGNIWIYGQVATYTFHSRRFPCLKIECWLSYLTTLDLEARHLWLVYMSGCWCNVAICAQPAHARKERRLSWNNLAYYSIPFPLKINRGGRHVLACELHDLFLFNIWVFLGFKSGENQWFSDPTWRWRNVIHQSFWISLLSVHLRYKVTDIPFSWCRTVRGTKEKPCRCCCCCCLCLTCWGQWVAHSIIKISVHAPKNITLLRPYIVCAFSLFLSIFAFTDLHSHFLSLFQTLPLTPISSFTWINIVILSGWLISAISHSCVSAYISSFQAHKLIDTNTLLIVSQPCLTINQNEPSSSHSCMSGSFFECGRLIDLTAFDLREFDKENWKVYCLYLYYSWCRFRWRMVCDS